MHKPEVRHVETDAVLLPDAIASLQQRVESARAMSALAVVSTDDALAKELPAVHSLVVDFDALVREYHAFLCAQRSELQDMLTRVVADARSDVAIVPPELLDLPHADYVVALPHVAMPIVTGANEVKHGEMIRLFAVLEKVPHMLRHIEQKIHEIPDRIKQLQEKIARGEKRTEKIFDQEIALRGVPQSEARKEELRIERESIARARHEHEELIQSLQASRGGHAVVQQRLLEAVRGDNLAALEACVADVERHYRIKPEDFYPSSRFHQLILAGSVKEAAPWVPTPERKRTNTRQTLMLIVGMSAAVGIGSQLAYQFLMDKEPGQTSGAKKTASNNPAAVRRAPIRQMLNTADIVNALPPSRIAYTYHEQAQFTKPDEDTLEVNRGVTDPNVRVANRDSLVHTAILEHVAGELRHAMITFSEGNERTTAITDFALRNADIQYKTDLTSIQQQVTITQSFSPGPSLGNKREFPFTILFESGRMSPDYTAATKTLKVPLQFETAEWAAITALYSIGDIYDQVSDDPHALRDHHAQPRSRADLIRSLDPGTYDRLTRDGTRILDAMFRGEVQAPTTVMQQLIIRLYGFRDDYQTPDREMAILLCTLAVVQEYADEHGMPYRDALRLFGQTAAQY